MPGSVLGTSRLTTVIVALQRGDPPPADSVFPVRFHVIESSVNGALTASACRPGWKVVGWFRPLGSGEK